MTTELAYTYNDFGLPVKLTYTDVDGETRTVREETNLTYDGNGNIPDRSGDGGVQREHDEDADVPV